ncbi:hypothetical protein T492DRAFT_973678 [Pavlovales sp. CCMP2436]|nr:hypothetical protein T492DRAFT_973678 [Pavlovales sp. CCMP2436]
MAAAEEITVTAMPTAFQSMGTFRCWSFANIPTSWLMVAALSPSPSPSPSSRLEVDGGSCRGAPSPAICAHICMARPEGRRRVCAMHGRVPPHAIIVVISVIIICAAARGAAEAAAGGRDMRQSRALVARRARGGGARAGPSSHRRSGPAL